MMILLCCLSLLLLLSCSSGPDVRFVEHAEKQELEVYVKDKLFTRLLYPDSLTKYFLYPLYTASGKEITRGYPLAPREGERTDHPHQVGMWFTFGDVEGLDFWNNSSAVPPERKDKYGTIRFSRIAEANEQTGNLVVEADWTDNQGQLLLKEQTTFHFAGTHDSRTLVRTTVLTASEKDIHLEGNKEGLFGLRVDRSFEDGMTGHYLNKAGDTDGDVWGKRSPWVALNGEKGGDLISIVVFDHPDNPYYPGWTHARGYGLFSLNNLGGKEFNPDDEHVCIDIPQGESITFIHKLFIKDNGHVTEDILETEEFR